MDIEPRIAGTSAIDAARLALAALDQALAQRPAADGHALSVAVANLCRLRNTLATALRRDGGSAATRRRLDHVNALVSLVLAARFPMGGLSWPELEKARTWLASVVAEMPVDA